MKQIYTRILYTIFFLGSLSVRSQHPHISGNIFLSVKEGLFKADLRISNLPDVHDYAILLNSGMNIAYLRDSADVANLPLSRTYNSDKFFESFCYELRKSDNGTAPLPRGFRINYTGAFPVYNDSLRRSDWGDWKGNIAFNGKTLRASEQTAWYPVIYDKNADRLYQKVTIDINIHAPDARALYINGLPPQYGQQARFRSERPFPLLLFAGDFEFSRNQGTYLVNTSLNEVQAGVIGDWLFRIRSYFEKKLQIPYGNAVTLLADTPVSRFNNWLFVTYPTIASISPDNWLGTLVDYNTQTFADSSMLLFLAHELGHYYFGTLLEPNSSLRWVFLEGIAEYMALQALRDLAGEAFYRRKLRQYRGNVRKQNLIPLGKIKAPSEINETYRYSYVPLLLTVLENEIGKAQVWKWLATVLNSRLPVTNYEFFRQSLLLSGVGEAIFDNFANRYLLPDSSLQQVLATFDSDVRAIYYWGLSKETSRPGATGKPAATYTSIRKMKGNDIQLEQVAQKYHTLIRNKCGDGCTSEFNFYESLEKATEVRTRRLQKLADGYVLKEITF